MPISKLFALRFFLLVNMLSSPITSPNKNMVNKPRMVSGKTVGSLLVWPRS